MHCSTTRYLFNIRAHKVVCLLLFFLLFSGLAVAQTQTAETDSLENRLDSLTERKRFDSCFVLITTFLNRADRDSNQNFYGHYFLANLYLQLSRKRDAVVEYKKSLVYLSDAHKNRLNRLYVYESIADIYFTYQQYDSAYTFARAAQVYITEGNSAVKAHNANIVGYCMFLNKDYKEAIIQYRTSIELYKKANNFCALPVVYSKIAKVYFYSNSKAEAYKTVFKALAITDSCRSEEDKLLCKHILLEFYENDKNYEKAFLCLKEINALVEQIDVSRRNDQINELEVEYRTQLKEHENKALKQINAHKQELLSEQKIALIVALGTLIVFVAFIYLLVSSSRKLEKAYDILDEQKQSLENLNTLNQKIFSVISHDFREPLLSFQLVVKTLERSKNDPSAIRAFVSDLNHQLTKADQMLSNLLDWAKVELKIKTGESEYCNARQIASEIIQQQADEIKAKGLQVTNTIDEELIVGVPADALRIVFRNILANAIKFSYINTSIDISYDKERKFITVKDSGSGVPESKLTRLFISEIEPGIGTNNETGFGMGLYMCSELLRKYSGKLYAENSTGGGACFNIELPVSWISNQIISANTRYS